MKKGKKLNNAIESVRDFSDGVSGLFMGVETLTNEKGEVLQSKAYGTDLYKFGLKNKTTGEVTQYWADGGLRGALKMARVEQGQYIYIQHTGEQKIEQGTVQTYDVYEAQD